MQTSQPRRTYDHRIKQAILESGDRNLFPELEIPESTVRSWIHRGVSDAVTSELVSRDRSSLISEIRALRQRTALLAGIVGLLVAMLRASKNRVDYERFAEGESKAVLIRAIDRASQVLPLTSALRIAHLSPSRFHAWRQLQDGCQLDDQPSCPRVFGTRTGDSGALDRRGLSDALGPILAAYGSGDVAKATDLFMSAASAANWRSAIQSTLPVRRGAGER